MDEVKIKNVMDSVDRDIMNDEIINNNDNENPQIYSGSEEKMLNLIVEIIVKIIKKEVL